TATAAGGGAPTSNQAQATVTAVQSPALTLTKTASPRSEERRVGKVSYSYGVQNSGNVTLGPATFTVSDNKINSGTPFTCGTPPTTLVPNATVSCTALYLITQTDQNNGSVTNTATAAGGGAPTSNQAQATVTAVQSPALTLTKTASP